MPGDGGGGGDGVLVLRRQGPGAVQHQQGQRCLSGGITGALHPQLLHGVPGVPQAGGVAQTQQHMAHLHLLLHGIPCGAGHVGDDGPVIAQQGVEQGGLPGVGLT